MQKRNYTYVQEVFPEIERMLLMGEHQRKVRERFGIREKCLVSYACSATISLGAMFFLAVLKAWA